MQVFKYKGYDASGNKVGGEIAAESIEEVERRMAAQSVTIIAIAPAGMRSSGDLDGDNAKVRAILGKRVSLADSAQVVQDLAVMAETGVPFVEAVEAVAQSARTPLIRDRLTSFKEAIVGGQSVSGAMRACGSLFPAMVSDLVRVAEEGGRLDQALRAAASYLERSVELRKRIINAMLYPMVMLSVSFLTIIVLVVFVMPRFSEIFDKMGADIPATTKAMLALGQFLRGQPFVAIGCLVGALAVTVFVLRLPATGAALQQLLLRVPVLGDLLRNLALSRAFQSVATLLASNVSLIAALEHGAEVAGNATIRNGLLQSRDAVEQGRPLAEAMTQSKAFPPMLVQVVAVGERTGRLSQLLAKTSANLEATVDARLKSLVSIVEPVMIVIMGVVVGGITISIITPIYSVVQNVK
jgi:type IV pilus assembly protein PilC